MTPTKSQFEAFENAYQYFNKKLFAGELPAVILNLSRKSKAMGFVAPFRWKSSRKKIGAAADIHELSINPEILCLDVIEVFSTLVHEQCHIWQFSLGNPSRSGYHNREWADKMVSVGLMPSSTGKLGGKTTGQNMSDYPIENGIFLKALKKLPKKYKLPFISIEGEAKLKQLSAEGGAAPSEAAQPDDKKKKNKVKYSCSSCGTNVWGKPELSLICGACHKPFVEN